MFGTVKNYNHLKGFGFIKGINDQDYFFNIKDTQDGYIEKGYLVDFNAGTDRRGRINAWNIITIESDND
jgi:cold shock CspA family protein